MNKSIEKARDDKAEGKKQITPGLLFLLIRKSSLVELFISASREPLR